jgi:malonyl-CoA/methylmalonyl-CoA synthetase
MGERVTWEETKNSGIKNFPNLVRQRMLAPDAIFIHSDDGRDFTYEDYWTLAGRMANGLAAQGVKTGDRVAVQVTKSVEGLAIFLACARLGAIFLPLNTAYTATEMDYFVQDAEPALIVCEPEKLEALSKIARLVLTLDDRGGGSFADAIQLQPDAFDDAKTGWDDGIALLYTSGTTGRSKGALLTHGNLASNAVTLAEAWAFSRRDVLIHALPIYHTHGLFTATNTILLSGGSLLFRRKFDVDDVVSLFPQATALMGVPTFYTRLLDHAGLTRESVKYMRLFISGSAPLLAETHRAFEEKTGHAILERFGMTETNMNASNPYKGERRAGTVGLPLPGIEVRVTDPATGVPLPGDDIGMIEVRGPNVFKGYWRNPEKTAQEFRKDGFFITGDLGSFDGQGYLTISGRGKDLVITGGFNVYPKEIEMEIDQFPMVLESAVIGVPHPDLGEGVTALVVLKAGQSALDEKTMIAELQKHLAKYKVPKRIIPVPELPRNAMGKVQKGLLRQTYAGLFKVQRRPV